MKREKDSVWELMKQEPKNKTFGQEREDSKGCQ